jgi:hypothetical protein
MDEYFIEQLKQLRCGPCENDRGIEKLAHVMWVFEKRRGAGRDRSPAAVPGVREGGVFQIRRTHQLIAGACT